MRSQCPRSEHSGFKHCTVQPGRYCIMPLGSRIFPPAEGVFSFAVGFSESSGAFTAHPKADLSLLQAREWRDCAPGRLVCQGKCTQLVGVGLPNLQAMPIAARMGQPTPG